MAMKHSGFTLIELSIVLVIIGLIVGGVLVGQDLIKAAQMRSIHSDISRFEAARHTFRLKYNCLPGDCVDASTYGLGSNGTGDNFIENSITNDEAWLYWTHLGAAGLIEGTYTGTEASAYYGDAVIGTNVPGSKHQGVGYSIYTSSVWNIHLGVTESTSLHFMAVGSDTSSLNFQTFGGIFTVEDTFSFDQKFDDGVANDGNIRAHATGFHDITCTTGSAPNYSCDISSGGICSLVYLLRFN